jgi:hypothetical protein
MALPAGGISIVRGGLVLGVGFENGVLQYVGLDVVIDVKRGEPASNHKGKLVA